MGKLQGEEIRGSQLRLKLKRVQISSNDWMLRPGNTK